MKLIKEKARGWRHRAGGTTRALFPAFNITDAAEIVKQHISNKGGINGKSKPNPRS